jgi:hypothetical protein
MNRRKYVETTHGGSTQNLRGADAGDRDRHAANVVFGPKINPSCVVGIACIPNQYNRVLRVGECLATNSTAAGTVEYKCYRVGQSHLRMAQQGKKQKNIRQQYMSRLFFALFHGFLSPKDSNHTLSELHIRKVDILGEPTFDFFRQRLPSDHVFAVER